MTRQFDNHFNHHFLLSQAARQISVGDPSLCGGKIELETAIYLVPFLVDRGAQMSLWWLEEEKVYRQDSNLLHSFVEYLSLYSPSLSLLVVGKQL